MKEGWAIRAILGFEIPSWPQITGPWTPRDQQAGADASPAAPAMEWYALIEPADWTGRAPLWSCYEEEEGSESQAVSVPQLEGTPKKGTSSSHPAESSCWIMKMPLQKRRGRSQRAPRGMASTIGQLTSLVNVTERHWREVQPWESQTRFL